MPGSGTELDPYLITQYSDLAKIELDLNDVYSLENDIDAIASQSGFY